MKKLAFLSLFVLLSSFRTFSAAFDLYENKVFDPGIRTVTLHPVGYPFGTPLIQLGTRDVLTLQFDELGEDVSDLRYAIVQCDHKWEATDVSTFDYIDGFSDGYVNDYDFSFNTTYNYVHYSMNIPNEDFQITQSGNYAVVIFRDDVEEPVLTRRFMVVYSRVGIEGGVAVTRNPSIRELYQEIVFRIDHEGFEITNPFAEINVVVTQNDRWDNAIYGVKPLHINENQLLFNYNMKIAFPTGREFREMDIRTLRYRTEGVRAIDIRDSANIVYLMPDHMRRLEDYRAEGDLNGKYLIDRQEGRYGELEADYAWVHFNLPFETPLSNGTFYVVGGFNDYELSEENKMTFNQELGAFETAIFMKQGFYNYIYVFVEDGKQFKDHSFTEGNYYDTENDYAVYVYYRPFGQRYDELIGFSFFEYKTDEILMEPKAGDLILAEPFMKDPNFKRTVVLLCENNEEGAFGLVLNKKLDFKVDHVLPEFPVDNIDLFYGGPVGPDTLHFIHQYGDLIEGSRHLKDNIYWSGNFEQIKVMLETGTADPGKFRFFVGYSGWSEGQLAEEMEISSWIVATNFSNIFMHEDALWQSILKSMGGEYKFVSTFPEDPQLN